MFTAFVNSAIIINYYYYNDLVFRHLTSILRTGLSRQQIWVMIPKSFVFLKVQR